MKLFFDTETTGMANFKESPDSRCQPRLVQLGALLVDANNNELITVNMIVKPDGFEIPKEASNIHGISTEKANEIGVSLESVMKIFIQLRSMSDTIIGHNLNYDVFVMRGEWMRLGLSYDDSEKDQFCTMQASTNICKIPGKYGKFKWPKLVEVYNFAFGKEFVGAHDAMADIRATKDVYNWLQDLKKSEEE